ncbi:class I SAM-dependent methyltransferase [Sphingobacteriales bacterium UPWRP_1]|nr:hypothetical protein BVG80_07160 [Sphingobacteriales bacterium TSM_CSM]PSJ78210.1 class I SAM-dependent methyltransferase [Sphingobacteriales bacterium UPWRP_1]
MSNKWWQTLQYLRYLLTARTKYYIHSPFVYELCENVIYDKRNYYAFDDIELLRRRLLGSEKVIEVTDYGAGSGVMGSLRTIQQIAEHAGTPRKVGQLLFRLAVHLQAQYLLELGTSLGLGTLYLAKAGQLAQVITIEGCKQTAAVAAQNFKQLQVANIQQVVSTFEEALPLVLPKLPQLDLVFFDGNHRSDATWEYFNQCLPKAHQHSVFVFDDIYWSPDMQAVWERIKQHNSVQVTVDLFRVGLVFFRKEQVKEHFKLYF